MTLSLHLSDHQSWLTSVKNNSSKWRRSDSETLDTDSLNERTFNTGRVDSKSSLFVSTCSSASEETCCTEKQCACSEEAHQWPHGERRGASDNKFGKKARSFIILNSQLYYSTNQIWTNESRERVCVEWRGWLSVWCCFVVLLCILLMLRYC